MMKIWDRAEQTLVGVLGIAALALALWQVVSRYFFPWNSISYAEEVIVYLLIWAIMIVSSQLVLVDGHVRPDLVLHFASAHVKRWNGDIQQFCGRGLLCHTVLVRVAGRWHRTCAR